jgi:hypothetical protein
MTVGHPLPPQSLAITANLAPLGFSGFIKASLFIRHSHFYHIPALPGSDFDRVGLRPDGGSALELTRLRAWKR